MDGTYSYTELDAVNEVLSSIGDSPVNSLVNLTDIDAINAHRILTNENRKFQSRGWSFNQNVAYVLNPDANTKKIMWTDGLLYIEAIDGDTTKYIKKGSYVYDLTNQTYIFTSAITVEALVMKSFDDMPVQARDYIVAKSSLMFAMKYFGDKELLQMLAAMEKEAWSHFQEYETDNNDYNMLDNTYISALKG